MAIRKFKTRIKEHITDNKNNQKTGVFERLYNINSLNVNFRSSKIIIPLKFYF